MSENNKKAIVKSIQEFLQKCPYIENNKICVDYLGEEAIEYTIDPTPTQKIVNQYLDGTLQCKFTFNFSSREYYSKQVAQNIGNSKFYEDFEQWLYESSKNNELPVLDGNRHAESIEALSSGYLFATQNGLGLAKYTIQCVLYYIEYK